MFLCKLIHTGEQNRMPLLSPTPYAPRTGKREGGGGLGAGPGAAGPAPSFMDQRTRNHPQILAKTPIKSSFIRVAAMTRPEPASGSPPPARRSSFWKRRRFWLLALPVVLAVIVTSLPVLPMVFGTRLKAENFDQI